MQRRNLLFSLLIILLTSSVHAQKKDSLYNAKKEVIVDGKRFRVYNNYLDIGAGEGLNTALPATQFILNVDFHFHIRKNYFQLGTFLSGDRFLSFNNYSAHLAYGRRWETLTHNIFVCAGPSYSWGYPLVNGNYSSAIYTIYGGYIEGEYIYKLAYDLGVGGSAFLDFNALQSVYGLRLTIFFSSAYRGDRKKKKEWDN
jgi:hypothetical protein